MADTPQYEVRGVPYPNPQAIAEAFDVSRGSVYKRIRRGTLDFIGVPRATPICIRKRVYPSPQAAAEGTGKAVGTIYRALERGTLDRVGQYPQRIPKKYR